MESTNELLDEVQRLTWALLDEQVTPEELARLEKSIVEDGDARRTYLACVQLHADLHWHFTEASRANFPVGVKAVPILLNPDSNAVPPAGNATESA